MNNITFTATYDINKLCESIFYNTPICCFEFSRVYPDGSRTELGTDLGYLEITFEKIRTMDFVYTPSLIPHYQRYHIVSSWLQTIQDQQSKKRLSHLINMQHQKIKLGMGFCLTMRKDTMIEIFQFGASINHLHSMHNFCINQLPFLEKFASYFLHHARFLIQQADDDRVVQPWQEQHKLIKLPVGESAFNDEIQLQRYYLYDQVYLTKREADCAYLLCESNTVKEIAKILTLSPRTVETHLNSIRTKTKCKKKSELVTLLRKTGVMIKSIS